MPLHSFNPFAPLAAVVAAAGLRRAGVRCPRSVAGGVRLASGVLAEYLIHARRVFAAASFDLLCAVLFRGAAFFIPATLQRRRAAV
ncbi:hypothetical protein [Pseudogulbenkiania subflava]|uniref:Uncharacterized protein n=1 Tax=Pseudogulbenkiania subflava DSM 22618 TaxID=1123014 RepID=A0A1Y6C2E5_9NEIS|nr:hypothetical protein [Pseudogulbenkiania subflava]SMF39769.1 hypothetical protein SAMN02745746_02992 [Pseudogulbenkiania subflava DSM 22618]